MIQVSEPLDGVWGYVRSLGTKLSETTPSSGMTRNRSSVGSSGRTGGGGGGATGALAPFIVKFKGLSPPKMYFVCLVPSRLNFFRLDGWVYTRLQ